MAKKLDREQTEAEGSTGVTDVETSGEAVSGKKRWLAVLRMEQYTWINDVAKKTGLKGSDIIVEILDRVMNDPKSDFLSTLAETRLKVRLQALNDKAAKIQEEREETIKQFEGLGGKREKVLA